MTNQVLQHIMDENSVGYEKLYTEYFKKLFNYGRKFTSDSALIEDSIQEFFLDIWKKRHSLPLFQSFGSYAFSAFRYILLRKLKKARTLVLTEHVEEDPEFSIEQQFISSETDTELHERMQDAINALTARQREAIFLRFYEGLSYEEVSTVLNITVKATYKIMARALDSLKEILSVNFITLFFLLPFFYQKSF